MPHTDHDIERAARRFQRLAADLDPTQARADDTDLQAVAAAATARTVEVARARGRSWNHVAAAERVNDDRQPIEITSKRGDAPVSS